MATAIKDKSGSWRAFWELGRNENGKRHQGTKSGFRLKRAAPGTDADILIKQGDLSQVGALDYAQYQERAIAGGSYVKPQRELLRTYAQRWIETYATPKLGPKTVSGYRYIFERYVHPLLGNVELQRLSPTMIQSAYAKLQAGGLREGKLTRKPVSARTVHHVHTVLSESLKWAVRWSLLSRNPCEVVSPPTPVRKKLGRLTPSECYALLKAAKGSVLEPMVHLGLHTGMRRGEVLGLKWSNVDLDHGTLSVTQTVQRVKGQGLMVLPPKTERSRRAVSLSTESVISLRAQRDRQRLAAGRAPKPDEWVFTNDDGGPINPDYLTHAFHRLTGAVGVTGRFHDLRHAHASFLLSEGIHPKIVSERLGHSAISITLDTYSYVLPGLQGLAAEAFDEAMRKGRDDAERKAQEAIG